MAPVTAYRLMHRYTAVTGSVAWSKAGLYRHAHQAEEAGAAWAVRRKLVDGDAMAGFKVLKTSTVAWQLDLALEEPTL